VTGTVHLLVAPDAGRGKADGAYTTVLRTLAAEGAEVVDITGTDAAASSAAAAEAVAAGAERLVVVGGDGLVHLGLQAVAGTPTILGVVPVGTGNDFARGIPTIPTDPADAARVALGDATDHNAIRVDTGPGSAGKWIASVATIGFSGDVNGRANQLRFPRGPSRYTVATILELPGLTRRRLTLEVDGAVHDYSTALLAVGNTAWFGGGMQICPDADPTDGLLDVTVVADVGRIELLRFFRLVFAGRHLSHAKVHSHRGREIRVSGADIELWGDGELVTAAPGDDPITLRAVPGALRLAAGPQS
jgi:diacylglycerol kinase (ATP)